MTEPTTPPKSALSPARESLAALRRLPDIRAALEALGLFLLILLAGLWAAQSSVLVFAPLPPEERSSLWLSAFLWPALGQELVFRSWLPRGSAFAAMISLAAYVAWHPLQAALGLPMARPEFREPYFLLLVAGLGLACTLTRMRSGSIWPGVIIHWGVVVAWLALFGGHGATGLDQAP